MAKEQAVQEESELVQLTPSEALPILTEHALAGESVGLEGPPGGGKSEIVTQAAAAANLPVYLNNCEMEDVTDEKGLPFANDARTSVNWLKDKKYLTGLPMAFFEDELPRGTTPVQGVKSAKLLEKRIDDVYLHPQSWIVWAGNRTSDRAGANRVPSIIYQRCYMYELIYSAKDQIEWMLTQPDMDMLTIRFLRMKGDTALAFDPAKKINPTPRSWSVIGRRLFSHPTTHFATVAGRVTKGLASELMSFRDLAPQLPSVEEVLLNPKGARVPENTSAQFLVTDMLADQASVNSFDALVEYAKRIPPEMQAKFVKDSMKRHPEVASTDAFVKWGVKFAEVLR